MRTSIRSGVMVVAVLFTACGGPSASPQSPQASQTQQQSATPQAQQVNLTMMTSYGPNQSRGVVLQKVVDEFNKSHEGKIRLSLEINPDHPGMVAKIRTMIAAGRPPDIFHYNLNPNDLAIPQSGQLMDFAPSMDASWKSRFSADDLALFTFDGKLVSLPWQQSPALFYYNKALFKQAGISQFPSTWSELLKACDAFKAKGVACVSLFTQNDAWHTSNALTYVAACLGGLDLFSKPDWNASAVADSFAVVKQLFAYGTADAVGANYDVSSKGFLLGKTAIVIDGPWAIDPMNKAFTNSEIAVARAPSCDAAKAPAGFITTDAPSPMAAGKPANKAHADAVVEWFKYFTSEPVANRFAVEGSQPTAFKQNVKAQDVDPLFANYLAVSANVPGKAISVQRVLRPSAQTALPAILEALALGKVTPAEAAKRLHDSNTK